MADSVGLSRETLEDLAGRRIFFVHQSVGNNILDGIRDIVDKSGATPLKMMDSKYSRDLPAAGLVHQRLGKNGDPPSKVTAFAEALDGGFGGWAEVAFVKFCFYDIRSQTDVGAVFESYRKTLEALRTRYPTVTFIHFTVPLVSRQKGLRAAVKRILGMTTDSDLDNLRRGEYNERLRHEYQGREPICDIARVESTFPDGRRQTFRDQGREYEALAGIYTDDGGHLNLQGRQQVARELLAVIAATKKKV